METVGRTTKEEGETGLDPPGTSGSGQSFFPKRRQTRRATTPFLVDIVEYEPIEYDAKK